MSNYRIDRRQQSGFTMIELIGVLIIAAILSVGYMVVQRGSASERRATLAAEHALVLIPAVQDYIKANSVSLRAAATPTVAVTVTPTQLFAGTGLAQGFALTNAFGQSFVVRINEPTAGRLDALILYSGGRELDYDAMRTTADAIGFAGGFVSAENPAVATGGRGQWTRDLASFGGAVGVNRIAVGVFAETAKQVDDFLHRSATPGRLDLNQMSTNIDMSSNDINRARTVTGVDVNATNGVLANNVALGKSQFGAVTNPSETIQTGPSNNLRINVGSREIASFGNDGMTRLNGDSSTDGNFYANGNIMSMHEVSGATLRANDAYVSGSYQTSGDGGLYWGKYGTGLYMNEPGWIKTLGNTGLATGGTMEAGELHSTGQLQVDSRAKIGEFLQLGGVASRDSACDTNGLIAREASGAALFCTNGVWRSAGGPTTGSYVARGSSTSMVSGVNTSAFTSFIAVAVSGNGNNYGAQVFVDNGFLGAITNYNSDYAKYATASFPVPAGAVWQVIPANANGSRTVITVNEYVQR